MASFAQNEDDVGTLTGLGRGESLMLITSAIQEYAWGIVRDCDVDSTCVLLTDKTTTATGLHYLGNYGVSDEVLERYVRHGICDCDPFTDVARIERQNAEGEGSFLIANHPRVKACGTRAEDYWRFVSQHNFEVVGASTMRLQPRLYLTVGVHRAPSRRPRGSISVELLSERIEILRNKVAAHLLSSMLSGGSGYHTLLSLISGESGSNCETPPKLSARETEIARLVCDGRQNKEIAWLASLSEYTVENHLRRIYAKFGIHNRAALVARMNGALP